MQHEAVAKGSSDAKSLRSRIHKAVGFFLTWPRFLQGLYLEELLPPLNLHPDVWLPVGVLSAARSSGESEKVPPPSVFFPTSPSPAFALSVPPLSHTPIYRALARSPSLPGALAGAGPREGTRRADWLERSDRQGEGLAERTPLRKGGSLEGLLVKHFGEKEGAA